MKRELVKPVTLEVDGEVYQLRLDPAVILDFEKATGKNILQVLAQIVKCISSAPKLKMEEIAHMVTSELLETMGLTGSDLVALLWALMGGEDTGMTIRDAARKLSFYNLSGEVMEKIAQVVREFWPESEGEGGDGEAGDDPTNRPTA